MKRDGKEGAMETISIEVIASKEEGVKNRFTNFDVEVELPAEFDEVYVSKLLKVVARGCTVSNTIINGAKVNLYAK